jgi:hypothetical protein
MLSSSIPLRHATPDACLVLLCYVAYPQIPQIRRISENGTAEEREFTRIRIMSGSFIRVHLRAFAVTTLRSSAFRFRAQSA